MNDTLIVPYIRLGRAKTGSELWVAIPRRNMTDEEIYLWMKLDYPHWGVACDLYGGLISRFRKLDDDHFRRMDE